MRSGGWDLCGEQVALDPWDPAGLAVVVAPRIARPASGDTRGYRVGAGELVRGGCDRGFVDSRIQMGSSSSRRAMRAKIGLWGPTSARRAAEAITASRVGATWPRRAWEGSTTGCRLHGRAPRPCLVETFHHTPSRALGGAAPGPVSPRLRPVAGVLLAGGRGQGPPHGWGSAGNGTKQPDSPEHIWLEAYVCAGRDSEPHASLALWLPGDLLVAGGGRWRWLLVGGCADECPMSRVSCTLQSGRAIPPSAPRLSSLLPLSIHVRTQAAGKPSLRAGGQ